MPDRKLICLLLVLFFSAARAKADGSYTRTSEGVIVYPDIKFSGNTAAVKLSVIADNIIRVLSDPRGGTGQGIKSLITVWKADPSVKWDMSSDDQKVTVHTRLITATVVIATGAVTFTDVAGRTILAEKPAGGRSFDAAVFEGESSYHIRQTFETMPGEAFYGLGQHQDGLVNYKGYRVDLFQNNTEVAIPFLLSSRNYGILWDNYSFTSVGDIRAYKPLSALRLYSAHDEEGWLTATYHNDKLHPQNMDLQLAASDINYAYLGDSKKGLPPMFTPAKGSVTWEGALASGAEGIHKFRVTYGGYVKIYIDGKLYLDRWRQSWNPGSAILDVPMEKR